MSIEDFRIKFFFFLFYINIVHMIVNIPHTVTMYMIKQIYTYKYLVYFFVLSRCGNMNMYAAFSEYKENILYFTIMLKRKCFKRQCLCINLFSALQCIAAFNTTEALLFGVKFPVCTIQLYIIF
ncbi:hypothetical protein FKM82_000635 [Ascaphus truei]